MLYTQLRSFHAVAREGSFTLASQSLHVSQPTLTTQVKSLEEHYGVELFFRHGRGVILTDLGRALYALTQRLLTLEEEAHNLLAAAGSVKTGLLRLGAVGPYHVMKMLAAFSKRHPQVRVSVTLGNSREVLQDLIAYRTDVGLLAYDGSDARLHVHHHDRFPVLLLLPREHPWCGRKGVALRELDGQGMVLREEGSTTRSAFQEAAERAGVKPTVLMEIGSREAVREAVAEGLGIGIISADEFVPDERLRTLPVLDAAIATSTDIVCLRERRSAVLVDAFFRIVP